MTKKKRIRGNISDMLGNFDYMSHWGVAKTRDEIIGKPILFTIGDAGEKIPLGKIVDCDPENNAWLGELYI